MTEPDTPRENWASRLVGAVMSGPLPLMLVLASLVVGAVALYVTPREEEPQIVVPLADVLIRAPGLSAAQVERQVATPLEKLLSQIDGVEYVYSASQPGSAVVTVRFYVGEDRERSLVKIYNKIFSHTDQVPAAVTSWVVKPIEIDDVPILMVALWSDDPKHENDFTLRRLAEEVAEKLQAVPDTNRITVTGGRPREIRVELDPESLAARRTTPLEVAWALGVSNVETPAGTYDRGDRAIAVKAGTFFHDAGELRRSVVNVVDGVPVYLGDVARVIDGPAESTTYTWLGFGHADAGDPQRGVFPAVVVSVAKVKGANAVTVSNDVKAYLARLQQELFPPGVHYRILRDYGRTADQKVNDLVSSLFVAVLTVVVFIGLFLGWRAAAVVAFAIPVCYGVTLGVNLLTGYTINRVTLFALILALGLLVDDPITGVDNIERYFRIGRYRPRIAVARAIAEIRGALVMATVAIVIAFAPMSFITGMMGPYMAPMAFNVPMAVIASTFVAFLVTPWMAYKLLRHDPPAEAYDVRRTPLYRFYSRVLGPLVAHRRRSWIFLGVVLALLVGAVALPAFRLVPLKLLPYDNKNEFQIVVDMPEGTTLEHTQAVARRLGEYLRTVPEVKEFAGFVGEASPMDFNGMVRHYYLRHGANQADLRVTLVDRTERVQQSHEIVLRIRRDIAAIGRQTGANIKLVEVPPGPPVISTVAVELYGRPATPYAVLERAAKETAARLEREPLVADVDTSVEADQPERVFVTDKEKAALSGIATEDVAQTLALATGGTVAGYLQIPTEANPLPILLRVPEDRRSSTADLGSLYVKGRAGITKIREKDGLRDAPQPLVPLSEIGSWKDTTVDHTIYHKNLRRVAYVYAEAAGRPPADVIQDLAADLTTGAPAAARASLLRDARAYEPPAAGKAPPPPRPLDARTYLDPGGGDAWSLPAGVHPVWDGEGEWFITVRVFRDLGIAFGVALLGIFAVLFVQTGSAAIAGIIMLAIPLTFIGIMPGFWLLNHLGTHAVDGFPDPVLFTATAMIGMIALAGIVVRNSLILVEFIHLALRRGVDLREALVQAGAVRTRPVFLTAGTALLGNVVITLDPIFSGLAWSVIFGIVTSTVFTLVVVPVVYYLVYARRPGHGLPLEETSES